MSHDADTPEQFQALLQKAEISFVDFHATWCGPCVSIAPTVVKQCQESGVNLIKVDVDKNDKITQKYGITSMPTLMAIDKSGTVLEKKVGGSAANVSAIVAKCKNN